jgi:hypothetical protein
MEGSVEPPLSPALGAFAIAGILGDVRDQAHIENTRAIAGGIKAAIKVEIRASELQPDLFSYLLQRFEALRDQDRVGRIDGRDGDRRYDVVLVVRDGDNLLLYG